MTGSTPEEDIRVIDYFRAVYYPIPPIFLPLEVQDALQRDPSVGAVPEPDCVRFQYIPFKDWFASVDMPLPPKQKHTETSNPSLRGAKQTKGRASAEACMLQ